MKNENNTIINNRLSDNELDQVNGGMKIFILNKDKKFISKILKIIFEIKKKKRN